MAVIVVGANGLIGSELVRHLSALGYEVVSVDIEGSTEDKPGWKSRASEIRRQSVKQSSVDVIYSDLGADFRTAEQLFSKWEPTAVVNCGGNSLASEFADWAAIPGESMTRLNQILCGLTFATGGRYVYLSSSMVYGNFSRVPIPEESHLNPVDPYGALKAGCELLVRAMAEQMPASDYAILRPSAVYGSLDSNERVLVKLLHMIDSKGRVSIRDSTERLDFTPVGLVGELVARVVSHEGTIRSTVNLANGMSHSLDDVLLFLREEIGPFEISDNTLEQSDIKRPNRGALDMTKFTQIFGDYDSVTIQDGLRRLIRDTREFGLFEGTLK